MYAIVKFNNRMEQEKWRGTRPCVGTREVRMRVGTLVGVPTLIHIHPRPYESAPSLRLSKVINDPCACC